MKDLRSDAGGAPLVEADLEIEGGLWRVRKRYLAARSAELLDLGHGKLWRGSDAEEKLDALMRGGLGREALRPLVWVAQRASFDLASAAGLEPTLAQLIEAETAETAGAGVARRVRSMVEDALGELVTKAHGRPRAGGLMAQAMERRDRTAAELAAVREKCAQAGARTQRLGELRVREREPADGEALGVLDKAVAEAVQAVEDARHAREQKHAAASKCSLRSRRWRRQGRARAI